MLPTSNNIPLNSGCPDCLHNEWEDNILVSQYTCYKTCYMELYRTISDSIFVGSYSFNGYMYLPPHGPRYSRPRTPSATCALRLRRRSSGPCEERWVYGAGRKKAYTTHLYL